MMKYRGYQRTYQEDDKIMGVRREYWLTPVGWALMIEGDYLYQWSNHGGWVKVVRVPSHLGPEEREIQEDRLTRCRQYLLRAHYLIFTGKE